ncbi:MAG TPA: FAD-dependent oxidoreductase [Bryobacteraceae bacterium]|nr:FAD-dependent oxidoreductase [Bryobacteraceae bacterium]
MQENFYQVRVPDATDYWMEMVKCRHACPVHTDACGYVTAIGEGRYQDAYRIARATNPFASICGRVCGAPCEANCRRGAVDAPVSIRPLKRFVTERFGPESGDYTLHRESANLAMLPPKRGDYERIAVVGGGVSGLTVAHDLVRIGYKVTVFEAEAEAGGMLTAGVPVFRLPRDLVRHEINAILSLGVELKCNTRLGRDFTIASLRADGYKAIFLGIGLPKGRKLPLPGNETPGVIDGMDFLRAFNAGKPLPLGKRVIVIGGGNVAYDVARSAVRPANDEHMAYDVARSALRLSGDKEVHVVCLESREEMPADDVEVMEGAEEGIHLHNQRGPRAILHDNGTLTGLRTVRCTAVFDAQGKFNPSYDETQVEDIAADSVIFAIGQTSDLAFLDPADGVESNRGLIQVNRETYQTTAPDVFACGDIAHGPRLFIDAIASAQIAARSMHDFLRGTRTDVVVRKQWSPAAYSFQDGWTTIERQNPAALECERRAAGNDIVEECYAEAEARRQGARCLRCNVNTVFDTSKCVACNGCVDVCPQNLIRLVGLSRLIQDEGWMQKAVEAFGDLSQYSAEEMDQLGGVMMKDETSCIRCSFCASRCPTHAIEMKHFDFFTECVTVEAKNPKVAYA